MSVRVGDSSWRSEEIVKISKYSLSNRVVVVVAAATAAAAAAAAAVLVVAAAAVAAAAAVVVVVVVYTERLKPEQFISGIQQSGDVSSRHR